MFFRSLSIFVFFLINKPATLYRTIKRNQRNNRDVYNTRSITGQTIVRRQNVIHLSLPSRAAEDQAAQRCLHRTPSRGRTRRAARTAPPRRVCRCRPARRTCTPDTVAAGTAEWLGRGCAVDVAAPAVGSLSRLVRKVPQRWMWSPDARRQWQRRWRIRGYLAGALCCLVLVVPTHGTSIGCHCVLSGCSLHIPQPAVLWCTLDELSHT